MIGNAHIDPVWLWQWPEGYQEVRATFQSAVDRLDAYPEYVFTCDSSLFFAWVEETDPGLFERIRTHVASGRFQVVGGWWIEPDCNIPAGESFARHALYGQRYLKEKFGVTATTGANIDSFGHNATIPQILAKSGCDSYVFLRPGPTEKDLPAPLFRWESPDGSSVLAYRIPHEYLAPKDDIGEHVERAVSTLPDDGEEWAVFYGVGNHGGGPTIANLEQIRRMGPPLEPSSLRAFFDGVNGRDVPTVRGELQYHGRGCYTSHSGIKRSDCSRIRTNGSRSRGSSCSSTSSTTRSPGRRSRPHTTTRATSSAMRRRSPPTRSTPRFSRSPGRSTSSTRTTSAPSWSSTRTRGRSAPLRRSSTRGCVTPARVSATRTAPTCRCSTRAR
jgi:hypothetical protein